ncbi:metallophosphoesterase [Intrasporangium sp. DVR]|uniref:metallophosphoesterase n=1 Tax=Intrasporangium sp. DVR TaxID=3127867 RepID=UPI00313A658A
MSPSRTAETRTALHCEPFVHLVDVAHDRALIAWGAFFFEQTPHGRWDIVDDESLPAKVGRRTCIGSSAEPFGSATVQVLGPGDAVVAEASTADRTWVWVEGLEPDIDYRYRVIVDGRDWAADELWDWVPVARGGYDLEPAGRRYDLRFRTWPHPDAPTPPLRFVAMGDYGVGMRSDAESSRRQQRIADVLDRLVSQHDVRFALSLGDNVYQGEQGRVDQEGGGEDDDWYSSFFQPYRLAIARVPIFPAIGNHDSADSEGSDDRAQMEDNFHVRERFHHGLETASVMPGLFYRLRYGADVELVCLDTSLDSEQEEIHRYFQAPKHREWLRGTFGGESRRWVIPFSHHPVYTAGPDHENDEEMLEALQPLFDIAGVRLVLAGHEHNFQVSHVHGRTYVVSGASGQLDERVPGGFAAAHTTAWSGQAHLLLIDIAGSEARLTPVAGLLPDGRLHPMTALTPRNELVEPPFVVALGG